MWPKVRDERVFVAAFGGFVALTWLSVWVWARSPYGALLDHRGGHRTAGGWAPYAAVGGWTLMMVTMMLPTTLPLVALFRSFVRTHSGRGRLTAALVGGYLLIWTLFGFVVHAGDHIAAAAFEQIAWLGANAWTIGAGIVLLAGLYQFTSLKHRCLEKCRSPLSFIMGHWRGGRGGEEAFRLGIHHGLFCIGCCWSLMLLMFVVSIGNLAWMFALAAVMTIEKNVSWGRRLSAPLGLVMIGAAASVVATHAWTL